MENRLQRYRFLLDQIALLTNERALLKEDILNTPPTDIEKIGYEITIREHLGTIDYKMIVDMFSEELDINVEDFRKPKVKHVKIKSKDSKGLLNNINNLEVEL
jgi:hypothetical protein